MTNLETALHKLYGNSDSTLKTQADRYSRLKKTFLEKFGESELHYLSTPGRTEIGGNHTDHNQGRVLAASVDLDSIAVAAKNGENRIILFSEGYDTSFVVDLTQLRALKEEKETTSALIRGISARFKESGFRIGGFNACMSSDVLPGSGLSSSASVEVLIASILNALYNDNAVPTEVLAKIGQYAENHYFGKPCGLMDQMACAVGGIISIDFKDPEKAVVEKVAFDFAARNYSLLVVDTGGNHADLTEDYASVPIEMKSVAKSLGKKVCREIDYQSLIENMKPLRDQIGDRAVLRAIHFLRENDRVTEQVRALKEGDFHKFMALVAESGDSSSKWLQNIYAIKNVREQGVALALAVTEDYIARIGEGACRVHGGGFAGTIQAFLPISAVGNYTRLIDKVFGSGRVMVLSIRPYGTLHLNTLISAEKNRQK